MIQRYKTVLPPRPDSQRSWQELRTLEDWAQDWSPLSWPAPVWAYAPWTLLLAPLDLAVCLVGSVERGVLEVLDQWP